MKGSITAVAAATIASLLSGCSQPESAAPSIRPVSTVELRYEGARDAHRYFATVASRTEVDQAFRVSGKIRERKVDIGHQVKAGDVLALLDDADYRLAEAAAGQRLQAAQARARQAESDWLRLQALKRDGSVSASHEEQAHSNLLTAQATAEADARQLELAQNQLQYTVLRAPINGVVTSLRLETGQVVAAGQPVIAIANEAEPEIVVDVPENHLHTFRQAQYRAALASAPDEQFTVELRELSAQAAAQTRTYRARLKPVSERKLPLGATATLIIERMSAGKPLAVVPAAALTQHQGQPALWAVNRDQIGSGTVELVNVAIHSYRSEEVLISGPDAGTLVVTAGVQKMSPGLRVALPEHERIIEDKYEVAQ
ncbi:efflux RND transporter periplasmic adaptor subunit [Rheinheimera muenzenbergensis]|uniref:Efflux RND transporter periplasmic adaptor subunit n=1 Tax=Rheinheimera muenzenbergensis TaxID=1193628 RepID=A0ABU8C1J2_9GAMM